MSGEKIRTQVLLLHSQQSTLDALSAGIGDRYAVHLATSGTEALNTLGETPIHVIVSAQELPGMSGLEALREAKKRSPDTIGILLAGSDSAEGVEALVGAEEVFRIVRGDVAVEDLVKLIDDATRRLQLATIAESANDNAADVDEEAPAHIVMETDDDGHPVITDLTDRMRALRQTHAQVSATPGGQTVEVLVLTRDEEFLQTIRDSAQGLHNVHHANTAARVQEVIENHSVGVLVTDAAMVSAGVDNVTQRLRQEVPRLVTVVAGRRDDGEMLMDLINRGQVYRFLLKPVSPGRARLAIEASVKHHLEAPDAAFKRGGEERASAGETAAAAVARLRETAKIAVMPGARPAVPPPGEAADPAGADVRDDETGAPSQQGRATTGAAPRAPLRRPGLLIAAGAVAAVVIGLVLWRAAPDPAPSPSLPAAEEAAIAEPQALPEAEPERAADEMTPTVVETDIPVEAAPAEPEPYLELLERARNARSAGAIVSPPGTNAIELYQAARELAPEQPTVHAEFEQAVSDALGLAELAILEQRAEDAAVALSMVRAADPDNARIGFLDRQLSQLELRSTLDEARVAIREGRLEDANAALATLRANEAADATEVALLEEALTIARSAKQLDEVLAAAAERLEQGNLTLPANDNARYYYELALENDAENVAALQGLAIVAGRLVRQAETAIAEDRLDEAGQMLSAAAEIDSDAEGLDATAAALASAQARQAAAMAAQRARAEVMASEQAAGYRASFAAPSGNRAAGETASLPPAEEPGEETAAAGAAADSPAYVAMSSLTRTHYVAPRYPRSALRREVTGWVDLSFTVTPEGNVADIAVMNSRPGTVFNESAMDAVEQWQFDPPVQDGRPVARRVAVRMMFELE